MKNSQEESKCDLPKNRLTGTSLVVQWLGLRVPNAWGPVSIPGQGARSHMPQLRVRMPSGTTKKLKNIF